LKDSVLKSISNYEKYIKNMSIIDNKYKSIF
jgi:hypothetical protein